MSSILILAGLTFATVYMPMTSGEPSVLRSVVKTMPMLTFALAVHYAGGPVWLMAALGLSAMGDLALSRRGEIAFLIGLTSFALAHIAYIVLFIGMSGNSFLYAFASQPVLAVALVSLGISAEFWLVPYAGKLRFPVRAYVVVITLMGLAALTMPIGPLNLGAILFILSDVVLALQLFRLGDDSPLSGPAGWQVWGFYIAGQALILSGAA